MEATLWYPQKFSGTCDAVGIYSGAEAILDFKNSRSPKKKKWITSYLLQVALYSLAHNKVFNSINYKKWKKDNLTSKLTTKMNILSDSIVFWDQDVLNSHFDGEYLELNNNLNYNLKFSANSVAHQEPRSLLMEGTRTIMNTIRFTQLGKWTGEISTEAGTLNPKAIYGIRDRSWGVRPVGEPEGGAPGMLNQEPGVYWCWAPVHFDGFCTQFGTFEDRDGNTTQISGHKLPLYEDMSSAPSEIEVETIHSLHHSVKWQKGTRWATGANISGMLKNKEKFTKLSREEVEQEYEKLKRKPKSNVDEKDVQRLKSLEKRLLEEKKTTPKNDIGPTAALNNGGVKRSSNNGNKISRGF